MVRASRSRSAALVLALAALVLDAVACTGSPEATSTLGAPSVTVSLVVAGDEAGVVAAVSVIRDRLAHLAGVESAEVDVVGTTLTVTVSGAVSIDAVTEVSTTPGVIEIVHVLAWGTVDDQESGTVEWSQGDPSACQVGSGHIAAVDEDLRGVYAPTGHEEVACYVGGYADNDDFESAGLKTVNFKNGSLTLWVVEVELTAGGTDALLRLGEAILAYPSRDFSRRLGVVVDGVVHRAVEVIDPAYFESGTLTVLGGFELTRVQRQLAIVSGGPLPVLVTRDQG